MTASSGGLVLEGKYPFCIKKVTDTPATNELLDLDKENEKILKASAIWQDPVEVEELDSVGLELRRQDLKISLLMDMVSELLVRQSQQPPLEKIKLTGSSVEFQDEAHDFKLGVKAEAMLYILPAFPRALRFYGEIIESEQAGCAVLGFHGTSVAVRDQIEKLLFTHHRRSIAQGHVND